MSLIDQSPLWLLPILPLGVLMGYAMLEFTASLLVERPPASPHPSDAAELRRRLLALNAPSRPYRLVPGNNADLELQWDVVDASWYELFARVKLTTIYRARMLLDEARREVRWFEYLWSANWFLGFDGWRPRFNWSFHIQAGYMDVLWTGRAYGITHGFPPRIGRVYDFSLDTVRAKREIRTVVRDSGWTFRPVLWWFQVSRPAQRLLQGLVPRPLRRVSARRFWGILYPASFLAVVGYALMVAWPLRSEQVIAVVSFSVFWWLIWGIIAWALCRFPPLWRGRRNLTG